MPSRTPIVHHTPSFAVTCQHAEGRWCPDCGLHRRNAFTCCHVPPLLAPAPSAQLWDEEQTKMPRLESLTFPLTCFCFPVSASNTNTFDFLCGLEGEYHPVENHTLLTDLTCVSHQAQAIRRPSTSRSGSRSRRSRRFVAAMIVRLPPRPSPSRALRAWRRFLTLSRQRK